MIVGRHLALLGRELSRLGRSEWIFLARAMMVSFAFWLAWRRLAGHDGVDPRRLQLLFRELFVPMAFASAMAVGTVALLVSGAVTLTERRRRMHDLLLLAGFGERTTTRVRVLATTIALTLSTLVLLPMVATGIAIGGVESEALVALSIAVALTGVWASALGVLVGAVARDHVIMVGLMALACWMIWRIASAPVLWGATGPAFARTLLLLSPAGGLLILADAVGRNGLVTLMSFAARYPHHLPPGSVSTAQPLALDDVLTASLSALLAAWLLSSLAARRLRGARESTSGSLRARRDRRRPQRVARRWKGEPGSNPVSFRANRLAGLAGDRRHVAAAAAILVGIVLLLEAVAATRPDRLESYPAVLAQIYGWLGLVAGGIVLPFAAFRLIRPERDSGVLLLLYATPVPHGALTWGRLRPPLVLAALLALPWLTQVSLDLLVDAVPLEAVAMSIAVLVCTWLALGYLGLASALAFRGELASVGVPLAVVIGYCALRVYQSRLSYHVGWDAGWRFRTFELPFLTLGCESWPGVKRRWIEGEALVPVLTDLVVLSLSAFALHVLCSGVLLRRAVERS